MEQLSCNDVLAHLQADSVKVILPRESTQKVLGLSKGMLLQPEWPNTEFRVIISFSSRLQHLVKTTACNNLSQASHLTFHPWLEEYKLTVAICLQGKGKEWLIVCLERRESKVFGDYLECVCTHRKGKEGWHSLDKCVGAEREKQKRLGAFAPELHCFYSFSWPVAIWGAYFVSVFS